MADLGRWTGGTVAILPTTSWEAPNALFPTEDRNDGSAYSWTSSTSTLTLPGSGLADGYLIIGAFEFEDSSNGRHNPQGKIVQASGTGTFVGAPTGGFNRDTSEDRSYVRCWAFVDNPSASATFQFQWKRDADVPTGGTVRSSFEVIPLYYGDVGVYASSNASLYGGTTPNVVTGWTGTNGTNITLSSNVITVAGDNKRYLVLGSQFFEGRGGRTQRWHGLDIDGTQEDAAKAYSHYRNTSNDESGEMFSWLLETGTANVTIEQTCYRGDGVASGQGGADVDGSTPTVGDHATVVIELNDSAEVFRSTGSTNQNVATTGPVDIQASKVADVDFNDSASFTRASDTAMNAVKTGDYLFGANISAASQAIASGLRFTGYGELTVNGTENPDTVSGDYLRGNNSTQDAFGWSANLLSFQRLTSGDDVGLSVTELPGTEGGGGAVNTQVGWVGFWGVNLDTLEVVASDDEASLGIADGAQTTAGATGSATTTLSASADWSSALIALNLASGTDENLTVTAGIGLAGDLSSRDPGKGAAAGLAAVSSIVRGATHSLSSGVSLAASVSRGVVLSAIASGVAIASSAARAPGKGVSAGSALASSVRLSPGKVVGAGAAIAGVSTRSVAAARAIAAGIAVAATPRIAVGKNVTFGIAGSSSAGKAPSKNAGAGISIASAVSFATGVSLAVVAGIGVGASAAKGVGKRAISGASLSAGAAKSAGKSVLSSLASASGTLKSPGKTVTSGASIGATVVFDFFNNVFLTVTAGIAVAGSAAKSPGKRIASGTAFAAGAAKGAGKTAARGIAVGGSITRDVGKSAIGGIAIASSMAFDFFNNVFLSVSAGLGVGAGVVRDPSKLVGAGLAIGASSSRGLARASAAGIAVSGSALKAVGKKTVGGISIASIVSSINDAGNDVFLAVVAGIGVAGSAVKSPAKRISSGVSAAVSTSKELSASAVAGIGLSASVARSIGKKAIAGIAIAAQMVLEFFRPGFVDVHVESAHTTDIQVFSSADTVIHVESAHDADAVVERVYTDIHVEDAETADTGVQRP